MKALALGVCLFGGAALAQNYLPFKMFHDAANPFPYYLDARSGTPAGLSLAAVETEINASWGSWNAVTCSTARAASQGGSDVAGIANVEDPYDVYSVSGVWITDITDPTWYSLFGSVDIISISTPVSYAGVLSTCDTYLNAVNYGFTTSSTTPTDTVDLQTAMVHEVGHCLGLDHYGDQDSVMNPFVPVGSQRRTLSPLDQQMICADYPTSNAVGAPCAGPGASCGGASLKCATQTIGGVTVNFCTDACDVGAGAVCDLPLVCTGSTLFSPNSTGACLRPNNSVTLVGAPCQQSPDCGSALGICVQQDLSLGGNIQWGNGYCYQTCSAGDAPCPANSACTDVGAGTPWCLESCRVGFADCRPSYSCALTVNGGVCIPSCYSDADCGDTSVICRVCDGLCVPKQNATGKIGDTCTTDDTCGPGQVCANLDPNHSQKQCTVGCSRGCGTCPSGSSCHPLPQTAELVCQRDCSGLGNCGPGTMCVQQGTGSVCWPSCQTTNECPVGLECLNGECQPPGNGSDGGCGGFCNTDDAGMPLHPKDGGVGGGLQNSGGCGCQSSEGSALTAFGLALLAAAFARRVRSRG